MWEPDIKFSSSIKEESCLRNRKNPRKLQVTEVQRGIILPYRRESGMTYGVGGVVDSDNHYVNAGSFFHVFNNSKKPDWGGGYDLEAGSIKYSRERVVFAGFINNNEWGHFLTDWSSRLWYAVEDDLESKVVYCQRGKEELLPNIKKALDYAGISDKRLLIIKEGDMPIQFETVVIPDSSFAPEGYADEYLAPFLKMTQTVLHQGLSLPQYSKVYLSRTGLNPNKDFGEKEIEKFYESNGYQVLKPETLSLEEQIYYLEHSQEVVSLEGTPAHNIVFSEKGITQTILEKTQAVNARQMLICQCCEAKVSFVGVYPRIKFYDYYSDGPFLVGITRKFVKYASAKGTFPVKPKEAALRWGKNYIRYVSVRIIRRFVSFLGKGVRFIRNKKAECSIL